MTPRKKSNAGAGSFYEHILHNLPVQVFAKDEQGRYVFANRERCRSLGRSADELRGKTDADLFPEDVALAHEEKDREVLAQGRPLAYEETLPLKDGPRHVTTLKSLFTDPGSGERFIIGFVQDVTEARRAQDELAETEGRYRRIMADANDAIIIADTETGLILDANHKAEEFTGRPREELIGMHQGELHPAGERDHYEAVFKEHTLKPGAVASESIVLVHKDGSRLPVEVSAGTIRIGSRKVIQGIFRDIGPRLRREALLREQEEKFRTLFTASPEALFLESSDGRILDCNPAAERMSGYSRDELLALRSQDLTPKRRDKARGKALPYRARTRAGDELLARHKNGRVFPVEINASTFKLGGEKVALVVMRDITERKEMQARLISQALRDPLTGLANRTLLLQDLKDAMDAFASDKDRDFALVFIDLSRFKIVNDSLGHKKGDELLVEVGDRIRAQAPPGSTVARLGGDEFIVLLRDLGSYRQSIRAVQKIRNSFDQPFELGSRSIKLTACMGIVHNASGQKTPLDLMQSANVALHHAKERGKDRVKVFHPSLLAQAIKRLDLENDLVSAIQREEELYLVYQPIFHIGRSGRRLCAFETLARWDHPRLGLVSPGSFIPLAEDTGLIVPLGLWVLKTACAAWAAWQEALPLAEDIFLTVNLSAAQLGRGGLTENMADIVGRAGMRPDRLKLELTETAVMSDASMAEKKLKALKELGLSFAIDDFGTGYSSMAYLQRLPIDTLKIDLSFVRHVDVSQESLEIVRGIIILAKALGMTVVAEGVERPEQERTLAELGCDCCQGFLYARPMPFEDVAAFIEKHAG